MIPPASGPLAPSVEKAYYRKCIQLKRRLNDIEQANDELRLKRIRLDRSILKLRLERAFLLEQLTKRMEPDVDLSDGSEGETLATPPPDRPHRDKRRRPAHPAAPAEQTEPSRNGAEANEEVDKTRADDAGEDEKDAGQKRRPDAGATQDDGEDETRIGDGMTET